MSIREIKLENFKRFHEASFCFDSPITFIYGPNSSGKSSIIKSLLSIKQTTSEGNEHEVFSAQGEYVDLGSYFDFIYSHDVSKEFQLTTTHKSNQPNAYSWLLGNGEMKLSVKYSFDNVIESAKLESLIVHLAVGEMVGNITLEKKRTREDYWIHCNEELVDILLKQLTIEKPEIEDFRINLLKKHSVTHLERLRFRQKQEKSHAQHDLKLFVLEHAINMVTTDFGEKLFYLGPLRNTPLRSYIRTSHNINVGPLGEHTSSVFANIEARRKKVTRGTNKYKDASEQIAEWMNVIFPGAVASAETYKELVKLYLHKGTGNSPKHADVISDVGFGLSQVFPIIVQLAIMPKGATLIVEQPELHLHPKAQVALAFIFANAARNGKRLIIESHSEHLLRGIQIQISRGRLKNNDPGINFAKVIYVPESPEDHFYIDFNEYGELTKEWPSGFFDEAYILSMELMMNKGKGI